MTAGTLTFTCSICGEPSSDICIYCTKDACANHRCERCKRCSDCCECEVPLSEVEATEETAPAAPAEEAPAGEVPASAPAPSSMNGQPAEPALEPPIDSSDTEPIP